MIKHKIEFVLVSDDETQDKITQKEGFEISDEAKKHVIEQMKGELQKNSNIGIHTLLERTKS